MEAMFLKKAAQDMNEIVNKKTISCSFTGHRAAKLPWGSDENNVRCIELKTKIFDTVEAVHSAGKRHFICGMATGCDLYFCEAVLKLRELYDDITVEAAIPWSGQADSWDESLRTRYRQLCDSCDFQTIVQTSYSPSCMMRRNKYMVDNSSLLIACYDGKSGGTQRTMLYAIRQGVEVIEIEI